MSVPQMAVRFILISTSLMPIHGRGTSRSQIPSLASAFTSACIVVMLKTVAIRYMGSVRHPGVSGVTPV